MNVGNSLKTTNPLPPGIPITISHGSLPTITAFAKWQELCVFPYAEAEGWIFLQQRNHRYSEWGKRKIDSESAIPLYVPAVKTITPTKQNSTLTAIDVENVKLDYQPGDAPRASAKTGHQSGQI